MKLILVTPNHKRDYTAECVIEGLQKLNCEIFATDLGNGITTAHSEEFLSKIAPEVDGIVYFFGKVRDNKPPKHHLFKDVKGIKKFYIDGSEWTSSGYPEPNQLKDSLVDPKKRRGTNWINESMWQTVDFYLKRETYPEDLRRGILPLSFGLMDRHVKPNYEKDIDVFCVFGQTVTGLREPIYHKLLEMRDSSSYKICVSNSLSKEDYERMISRSRIVIDAWGGGDSCDRFYEAVGTSACCLYQQYQTILPNSFLDMEHAVTFSNMDEFSAKLRTLLDDSYLCQKIGVAGFDHAMRYHTSVKRAEEITSRLR